MEVEESQMEEDQMEETQMEETQMEEKKSINTTGIDGIDETSKKILIASGIIFNSDEYPDEILILRDSSLTTTFINQLKRTLLN